LLETFAVVVLAAWIVLVTGLTESALAALENDTTTNATAVAVVIAVMRSLTV